MLYILVGLVLSTVSFLFSSTAVSLLLLLSPPLCACPLSGFLPLLLLPPPPPPPPLPPPPHFLGHHPWRMCGAAYSAVPHNRTTSQSTVRLLRGRPGTTFPPLFAAAVGHSAVSPPNTKGMSSVDPSVVRNSLRSWGYASLPSLKLSARSRVLPTSHHPKYLPVLVTALCFARATALAKKSRHLRMVISMLSQRSS